MTHSLASYFKVAVVIAFIVVFALLAMFIFNSSTARAQNKPTFNGLWNLEGYSMIAEIKGRDITLYEFTPVSCLAGEKIKLDIQDSSSYLFGYKLSLDKETETLVLSYPIGYSIYSTPVSALPENCLQTSETTPVDNFEIFWHTFNEHYAFFDLYDVGWQEQYDIYRLQVSEATTDQELFNIFKGMLEPLEDGHIGLNATINGEEQDYSPEVQPDWLEGFSTIRSTILDGYLKDEATFFAKRRAFISDFSENIAYLNITGMVAYYEPTFWQEYDYFKDLSKLNETLDKILPIISNDKYDALILDIRFNGGGHDAFSAEIASRFADKPRTMYTKAYWYQDSFSEPQSITVNPHPHGTFNKPIILLTSGVTASAAEIFTLMMREYPHVTVIGEPTAGEFSDVIERRLPNGFNFGLSKERYLTNEGINFEKVGITPDEEMLIKVEDFENGIDPLIDRAIELLNSQ